MSTKGNVAELMFLYRTGWSRFVKRFSLISDKCFIFPCAKMLNSSKAELLSHCNRWSLIEFSLDCFVFLKVSGDIPIYSSDLIDSLSHRDNKKNCIYHTCIQKPRLILNRKYTIFKSEHISRGKSRTVATFKMERFKIKVNDWKPLNIITNHSILDVAGVLDPPMY